MRGTQLLATWSLFGLFSCTNELHRSREPSMYVGLYTPGYKVSGTMVNAAVGVDEDAGADMSEMPKCQSVLTPHDDDAAQHPAASLNVDLTTFGFMHGDFDKEGPDVYWNAGAIWVEDAMGRYVKTLKLWVARQFILQSAARYFAVLPTRRFFCMVDPDVTTMATLRSHGPHHVTWNGKDSQGWTVPDGEYKLHVEVQIDERHPQPVTTLVFAKGREPWVKQAPPAGLLQDLTLTYAPH